MTPEEYAAWKKETETSKFFWRSDPIAESKGEYLFYRGGQDGHFIMITKEGEVSIGYYRDAIPHIGEARFDPRHSKKLAGTADDALVIVIERLGMGFLYELLYPPKTV